MQPVSISRPVHHFDGSKKDAHDARFRSRIKVRLQQCSPAYVHAMDGMRPLHLPCESSSSPFHRAYRCMRGSCVMTSNDRECVNPECGTDAAIGRSGSGSASSSNQSESYSRSTMQKDFQSRKTGCTIKHGEKTV